MHVYEGAVPTKLVYQFPQLHGATPSNFPDFTPVDYMLNKCGLEDALAVASLLWPTVIEDDGCVFIAQSYKCPRMPELRDQFGADNRRIERFINAHSIGDYFFATRAAGDPALAVDDLVVAFGEALQVMWQLRFLTLFPTRHFEVELADNLEGEDGLTITVYER